MGRKNNRAGAGNNVRALFRDGTPWPPAVAAKPDPTARVRPQSPNQRRLLEVIDRYPVVVAVGPAGTGKTYLAVAAAVAALMDGQVSRIVLARPAVEAGEALGFLPGNVDHKMAPYLRPLYDALGDWLGAK